ncbi:hypothetical protein CR513_18215, partial [Mucuna pruriens]
MVTYSKVPKRMDLESSFSCPTSSPIYKERIGKVYKFGWKRDYDGMSVVKDALLRLDAQGPYGLNKMNDKASFGKNNIAPVRLDTIKLTLLQVDVKPFKEELVETSTLSKKHVSKRKDPFAKSTSASTKKQRGMILQESDIKEVVAEARAITVGEEADDDDAPLIIRMDSKARFSQIALPVFNGKNYDLWAIKMEAYLEALDLWEAIEEDYEVLPLLDNPTIAQTKNHKEKKTRKAKAKPCLFVGVSTTIFIRIMTLKSAKAIWDYLKGEYAGDERIQSMQVLNLMREFELQMMKEFETIKEYSNRLLSIANKIRLLGSDFANSRIVEKILVTVPERYEVSITSLENSKDLSKITLPEVLHALMVQKQRRLMREDRVVEGALLTKHHDAGYNKNNFF